MDADTEKAFDEWLQSNAIINRYAKDVRSRVRRAAKLIDINSKVTDDELLFRLGQHEEFKALSASVKSQVKRGVTLYRKFMSEHL